MFAIDPVLFVLNQIKNADTHQRMNIKLIEKLTEELKEINYKGSVTLCGYGEPMLHKEVNH